MDQISLWFFTTKTEERAMDATPKCIAMTLTPKQVSVVPAPARTAEEMRLLSPEDLVKQFSNCLENTIYVKSAFEGRLDLLKKEMLRRLKPCVLVHAKKRAPRKILKSVKPKAKSKAKAKVSHKK